MGFQLFWYVIGQRTNPNSGPETAPSFIDAMDGGKPPVFPEWSQVPAFPGHIFLWRRDTGCGIDILKEG